MSNPFAHGDVAEANRRQKAAALAATADGLGYQRVLAHERPWVLHETEGVTKASDLTWRLVDQLLADPDRFHGETHTCGPHVVAGEDDAPWWA